MTKDATQAKRAFGRSLTDFPDRNEPEQALLRACAYGEFARFADKRPREVSDANRIRAGLVRFLALGGDAHNPVHERGIQIKGAWIEGDIELESCEAKVPLALDSCFINGMMNVTGAKLLSLALDGTMVHGIDGEGLHCDGFVHLRRGFRSRGEVQLIGARIGESLECTDGTFDGSVEVVRQRDECPTVKNPKKDALSCDGIETGDIFLNEGFRAIGNVRLLGARIGGDLVCIGSTFEAAKSGDGAAVEKRDEAPGAKGDDEHPATAIGSKALSLKGGGQLQAAKDRYEPEALNCNRAEIKGGFFFQKTTVVSGLICLAGTQAATLEDDVASWEGAKLLLDGFYYIRISGKNPPIGVGRRIKWLERQADDHLKAGFRPQPWQQLARVLAAMGYDERAKQIRIEMRDRWRPARWRFRNSRWQTFWWWLRTRFDWLLGWLIAYGYRPGRAVGLLVGLWFTGGLIYWAVAPLGVMGPTDGKIFRSRTVPLECKLDWVTFSGPRSTTLHDELRRAIEANRVALDVADKPTWDTICRRAIAAEYSEFSPWLYSADLLIPFLDARQKANWRVRQAPDDTGILPARTDVTLPFGIHAEMRSADLREFVQWWQWFQITVGWALLLLLGGAVSGIIKKD